MHKAAVVSRESRNVSNIIAAITLQSAIDTMYNKDTTAVLAHTGIVFYCYEYVYLLCTLYVSKYIELA